MKGSEAARERHRERALTVYWHGQEVAGALVYGLRAPGLRPSVDVCAEWPNGTECGTPWRLHGDRWEVDLWTIRAQQFPAGDEWVTLLRRTLEGLERAGYEVSWFAPEGDFADPPDLFNRAVMGDGVYAAFSSATGFLCRDDGVGALRPLAEGDLSRLRHAAERVWTFADGGTPTQR